MPLHDTDAITACCPVEPSNGRASSGCVCDSQGAAACHAGVAEAGGSHAARKGCAEAGGGGNASADWYATCANERFSIMGVRGGACNCAVGVGAQGSATSGPGDRGCDGGDVGGPHTLRGASVALCVKTGDVSVARTVCRGTSTGDGGTMAREAKAGEETGNVARGSTAGEGGTTVRGSIAGDGGTEARGSIAGDGGTEARGNSAGDGGTEARCGLCPRGNTCGACCGNVVRNTTGGT